MKKISILICSILLSTYGFSQEENNSTKIEVKISNQEKQTQAIHTHKSGVKKVNILVDKIYSLTNGNSFLTEMVVKELKIQNPSVKNIISDVSYSTLDDKSKKQTVKESEVFQIIENLKAN